MIPSAEVIYRVTTPQLSEYIKFGVVVYGVKGFKKTKGGEDYESCCIEDISDDKEFIEILVKILNRDKVELCHFESVVLDYINALESERKDML